jgi:hypothetical protein
VSPFQEATYDQLGRLLTILDYYKGNPGQGMSVPLLHEWASGGAFQPAFSTEWTLSFWENVIIGDSLIEDIT